MDTNILKSIRIASECAAIAHNGQFRKNKPIQVPYIVHPARVAYLISKYDPDCHTGIISAWLHDVLEDCGDFGVQIFSESLYKMPLSTTDKFDITNIVSALTKDDNIHPRASKLQDSMYRLTHEPTPPQAVLVKICDRIDNLNDMEGFKRGFMRMYLEETLELMDAIIYTVESYKYDAAYNDLISIVNEKRKEISGE